VRGAEAPSHHGIDGSTEQPGERRRIRGQDRDTMLNFQPVDEAPEVVRAGRSSVDQHDVEVGSHPGDHEARHTSAAAEVNDGAGHVGEGREEGRAVLDHIGNRGRTEHPETSGGVQRLDELGVVEARVRVRPG